MKTPTPVALAEAALKAKADELANAKTMVQQLEQELADATAAVHKAREEADADLPRCRMVIESRARTRIEELGTVVILRKTPGGMLVTRKLGEPDGTQYRFTWNRWQGRYTQAEKRSYASSPARELRDVPPEFLPGESPA